MTEKRWVQIEIGAFGGWAIFLSCDALGTSFERAPLMAAVLWIGSLLFTILTIEATFRLYRMRRKSMEEL